MKPVIHSLLVAVVISACTASDYGKKVTIEGNKGEVYYKGKGVNEADATKLCKYLNDEVKYFNTEKKLSVRLMKSIGDGFNVSFVVDEKELNKTPVAASFFEKIGVALSIDLYNNKPVNVYLTDDRFKEIKFIPYALAEANTLEEPIPEYNGFVFGKDDFHRQSKGGVIFYLKDISNEEYESIADYIVKNSAFGEGYPEIYMTKKDGRYLLGFPVNEAARSDASYLALVEKVAKKIKDNVFPNEPYSFLVTDEYLHTLRVWNY
jgi:hypothetical protein